MNQQVQLELTENEVNIILAGLGKLPFEVAAPIFFKIQQAAEKQLRLTPEPENTDQPGE